MAFVHRSARNLNAAPSSKATPANLGPGSYATNRSSIHSARPALAPFSSSADRGIDDNFFEHKDAGPGPGEYIVHRPVAGGGVLNAANPSFVSKVPRFNEAKQDCPLGPGQYIGIQSTLKLKRKKIVSDRPRSASAARPRSVSPVRPSAPSIPARHQSYGYEENEFGELVPLPPPDDELPSALLVVPPSSIDLSKGVHWAKSKSNRFAGNKDKESMPGPGQHNPKLLETKHISAFLDQKPGSSFLSQTQRVTEKGLNLSGIGADTPGPGAYGIPATKFDHISKLKDQIPPSFQFFGSKTERQLASYIPNAGAPQSSELGPGSHFNPKLASSIKVAEPNPWAPRAPFTTTAQRFSPTKHLDSGPGLAYARLVDYSAELRKRQAGRNNTFGVTSTRFPEKGDVARASDTSFDAFGQPIVKFTDPPHSYATLFPDQPKSYLDRKPTSSFLAGGPRFPVKKYEDEPVSAAEIVPKGSINPNVYASAPRTLSSSFASGQARFKPIPGSIAATVDCPVAPGQYDPQAAFEKVRSHGRVRDRPSGIPSASMGSSQRLDFTSRGLSRESPGVGAYDVPPPEYLKRSFNITIPS